MNSLPLTGMITTMANALANGHSAEEIALLSALLVQLGDTLATIAAIRAFSETKGRC